MTALPNFIPDTANREPPGTKPAPTGAKPRLTTAKPESIKIDSGFVNRYGESGIRTHGDISTTLDFESSALDQLSHLSKDTEEEPEKLFFPLGYARGL